MLQSQTVNQYAGFGNDTPASLSEYYSGMGVRRGVLGILFGEFISSFFTTSDNPSLSGVTQMVRGKSRGAYGSVAGVENVGSYLLLGDEGNGNIYQSYIGIFTPDHAYRVMNQTWHGAGMEVDPSGRLLYAGERYIGMMDSDIANYRTGTIAVTNGSAAVVGTGTTFAAGDVGKVLKVDGDTGTSAFYLISAFTDATHITLSTNYTGTTASGKGYTIFRSWDDKWKDFGTSISSMNDGSQFRSPSDTYEDTVLFGRRNNICSLNVTTDTITTDALPAFTMPEGYDNIAIRSGNNGILLGFNKQGKGTLVLWDNYSDRSTAPWIPLDDLLIGVQRYSSGWVVMTARGFYYTNGYTIQPLIEKFMGSSISSFGGADQRAFIVVGESLLFGFSGDTSRTRGGVYRLDLKTKLVECIGALNKRQYSTQIANIAYSPDFNRIYVSGSGGVGYISSSGISSSLTYYYISNEIGVGETPKIADRVRVPVQITQSDSTKRDITFTLECRVNNLDRQPWWYGQVASTSGSATSMTVNETVYQPSQIGDIVHFVSGNNSSCIRGITNITGGGTSSAVYTLDAALPSNPASSDIFVGSGFKPVEKKVVTNANGLSDMYFGIKNKYRGKHFRVMFIVTDAEVPIEILPFEFQYDDMGVLE